MTLSKVTFLMSLIASTLSLADTTENNSVEPYGIASVVTEFATTPETRNIVAASAAVAGGVGYLSANLIGLSSVGTIVTALSAATIGVVAIPISFLVIIASSWK